jgi:hypothetical protein
MVMNLNAYQIADSSSQNRQFVTWAQLLVPKSATPHMAGESEGHLPITIEKDTPNCSGGIQHAVGDEDETTDYENNGEESPHPASSDESGSSEYYPSDEEDSDYCDAPRQHKSRKHSKKSKREGRLQSRKYQIIPEEHN